MELGKGWVQTVDASGNIYFANSVTGQSAWEFPAEVLPPGWTAAPDPASGRCYFVELATQRTSWELPELPPSEDAATVATGAASIAGSSSETAGSATSARSPRVTTTLKEWKAILSFGRQEATSAISLKAKKLTRMKDMAKLLAAKKKETAARKAAEVEEMRQLDEAVAAAAKPRVRKPLMTFMEVPLPVIERKVMDEFAEANFQLNRKGMFKTVTTVSKVMSWKDEVIGMALLKMPTSDLNSTAIQCFKNVTGFMGDRTSGKEDGGHAEKLLKTTLHSSTELRDEVYCQIIKQTTNNPSIVSNMKGWQLMGIISGSLAPSKEFEPYLLSYCHSHAADAGGIGECAMYVLKRLVKVVALGPRRETPLATEIDACKVRSPVLMRVYHLDGSYDTVPVTSWTTASDVKAMVCEQHGIDETEAFNVYEMTPKNEERLLEPDERVLDIVAYWQRLFEEERGTDDDGGGDKKKKKRGVNVSFYRLVFKVQHYYDAPATDVSAQHELYVQAVFDVVSARYPCGERDCLALASLQLQVEYGDAGLPELKDNLVRFLPAKLAETTRTAELAAEVAKLHTGHAGRSKAAAETAYLSYVKEWQVYGSSFFFAEPQMTVDLPAEVFLAVNPKGVLIIDPTSKAVLATHPYSEVPTWGYSSASFVLHVGNLIKQTKIYFSTEQGREINSLIRAYVNHLCV